MKTLEGCLLSCARTTHNRLPREVRDMIYSQLWDNKTLDKIDYTKLLAAANSPTRLLPTFVPPFAIPKFVGADMAREVVEWLYENDDRTQRLQREIRDQIRIGGPSLQDSAVSHRQLRAFLNADVFHVKVTPKDVVLRQITVRVDVPRADKPGFLEDIEARFTPLIEANFTQRASLHIVIVQSNVHGPGLPLHNARVQLANMIDKFETKGVAVSTHYSYRPGRGYARVDIFLDNAVIGFTDQAWKEFLLNEWVVEMRRKWSMRVEMQVQNALGSSFARSLGA